MSTRSVNKVILVGNIGKDAEQKFTQSGTSVANFSVATARRFKQGDEWKEETDWHRVVLWGNEGVVQYLQKGKQVYIEGRLQTRSYEKDGEKRYQTEVVAEEVILLSGSKDAQQPAPASAPRQAQPARSAGPQRASGPRPAPAPQRQPEHPQPEIDDSDVPF